MVDFTKVQELLSENSPVDASEITPEKHLTRDLELDSFSLMDTVSSFEKEFDLSIPDRDLRLFNTVQDVVDYLTVKEAKA